MMRHTIVAAVAAAGLVTAAATRGRAADESPAATREPLRSIAAILALPIHEIDAGLEAVVTGTVTLSRDYPGADPYVVLQNGDDAVFVNLPRPPQGGDGQPDADVRLGSVVEVAGVIRPGGLCRADQIRFFEMLPYVSRARLPGPWWLHVDILPPDVATHAAT